MKKLLLATTALVFSAGFAAADVAVTGSATMGIKGDSSENNAAVDFDYSADVEFAASGASDNGLSYSMSTSLDDTSLDTETSATLSGGFGNISIGDTSTGYGFAVGVPAGPDGHQGLGFEDLNGTGPTFLFDTSIAGAGIAVSLDLDSNAIAYAAADADAGTAEVPYASGDLGFGVGATYAVGPATIGAGYESVGDASLFGGSVSVGLGAITLGGHFSSLTPNATDEAVTRIAAGGGYTTGALTVNANYAADGDKAGVGIGADYDLGGPTASVAVNMNLGEADAGDANGDGDDAMTWTAGLSMNF